MAKESSSEVALEIDDGAPDMPIQPSLPTVLVLSNSGKRLDQPASPVSPSPSPSSTVVLMLSNSGMGMYQSGSKTKYVKQMTGKHNNTELHLAAQRGDVAAVQHIPSEIDAQMTGTGEEFDASVAEIRMAVMNETIYFC